MRSFLKIFFASFVALVVFSMLAFFITVGFFMAIGSAEKPEVGANAVLTIDLSENFHEQHRDNPLGSFVTEAEDVPSLYDVVQLLQHAKKDTAIKGLYLLANGNANGFAASQEIRNAIIDFRQSGKFVYAYGEMMDQGAYFVANAADKVYCNPAGGMEWKGLSTTLMFFKNTLEKLEIKPQIFYAGKFKSATEPFRETKMTDANRLQVSAYLGDMFKQLLTTTAAHSRQDTSILHSLADNGLLQSPYDALKYRLIDGVMYDDQVRSQMAQKMKVSPTAKLNMVSIGKYAKAVDYKADGDERIAYIVAEGEIVDGKEQTGRIASDQFLEIIRKARTDKKVKAIVLRVNSPGGSSLASDVILRELQLAKKEKPVVVSFGNVAASGGYYISCAADSIFAQPTTITGSIGVFALIPNMQNFFNNKLGITFDRVKTGPYADMIPVDRPMSEGEKLFIQHSIDTIYHTFKQNVATGRKMSMNYVDSIAQGRVWTGERALQIGLVDRLGNIQDAVDCAVRMAKLKSYRIKVYPEKKGFIESIANTFRAEAKADAIKAEIGAEQYEMFMRLKSLRGMMMVPQARLPFDVNFQ